MFGPKAMKGFFGGGHRPGFGHGPRRGRMFERGDLKYVILDMLKDEPAHGYEIIRRLEERSRGFYSPSPGSVYPTLQLFEDMGQVTSTERDGKKVYAITDEGRKYLEENRRFVDAIWG
ncbi:MAG TPA: PadR family transcriptional regulator, partial [Rubrobacter sp.]|nr:PadR family transcriptional regulator [Rubrobacter sp.]